MACPGCEVGDQPLTHSAGHWSGQPRRPGDKDSRGCIPTSAPAAPRDTSQGKGHPCGEAEGQGGFNEGGQKKAQLSGSPGQSSWVPQRSLGTEVLSGCCLTGMGASVFIGQLSSDSSQEERRRQVDFLETSFSYEIGAHRHGLRKGQQGDERPSTGLRWP